MAFYSSYLDERNCKIIAELQQNGRVSFAEPGRRADLTLPAVAERVRKQPEMLAVTMAPVSMLKISFCKDRPADSRTDSHQRTWATRRRA